MKLKAKLLLMIIFCFFSITISFCQENLKFKISAVYVKTKDSFAVKQYNENWRPIAINEGRILEIKIRESKTVWSDQNVSDTFKINNVINDSSYKSEGLEILNYQYYSKLGKLETSRLFKNINNSTLNTYSLYSTSGYLITKFDLIKIQH